jgi:hypothetical protein
LAYNLKILALLKTCLVVILACSLLAGCSPTKAQTSQDVPTTSTLTATALVAESTAVVATTPIPPEKMIIGRRYSFPNISSNLIVINATTQTLFLSTFTLPADPSELPVETALIGMRYGRTYTFPDASFGTTDILRDASGQVIAVYAVTSALQQVFRVTNLSLVAAREAEPVMELKGLRSFWSGTARKIALHFVNNSGSEVMISWVDFDGGEELKATLQKGQRVKFESCYGNVWSVHTQSGQPVMAYYVTEADSQEVEITDEVISGIQPSQE